MIFASRNDGQSQVLDTNIKCKPFNSSAKPSHSVGALGMRQQVVAQQAGITAESLSRFERGPSGGAGYKKALAVLAVLGMELGLVPTGQSGMVDELRIERAQAQK